MLTENIRRHERNKVLIAWNRSVEQYRQFGLAPYIIDTATLFKYDLLLPSETAKGW